MSRNQQIGNQGEHIAAKYLSNKGYTIVARNWHCRYGEIDIIATLNDVMVFVEVKTITRLTSNPLGQITPKKREKLINAVYSYLAENPSAPDHWRIDAVGVILRGDEPTVQHVEDALGW